MQAGSCRHDALPSLTQLGKHLLTRSDLARLSVPAARILSWLANGWLDQIGALPDGRPGGDPVFTVQTRELRHELAARLVTIGKTSVVFTPLRVRSLLLRAMLTERMPQLEQERASAGGEDAAHTPPIELANHLEYSDLGVVLQEAIDELGLGVDSVQRIAEEEAALEAAEANEMASSEADAASGFSDATTTADEDPMLPDEEDEEDSEGIYFDSEALVDELDSWAGDPTPEEARDEPELQPAQESQVAQEDPQPEVVQEQAPTEPAAESAPRVAPQAPARDEVEESFAPTAAELDALREALASSLADYRNADMAFGQEDATVELPTQNDFADSIERLSATLQEVQMLANEAAALGDALSAEDAEPARREVHAPRAETLAELSMLDEPGASDTAPEAEAEDEPATPEEDEPTLEALRTVADSIFDQLTMLDEPKSIGAKGTSGERSGHAEEDGGGEPPDMDVPVEETMVELEALDPRDVLPELEPSVRTEEEEAAMTSEDEPTDGADLDEAGVVAAAIGEESREAEAAEAPEPAAVDAGSNGAEGEPAPDVVADTAEAVPAAADAESAVAAATDEHEAAPRPTIDSALSAVLGDEAAAADAGDLEVEAETGEDEEAVAEAPEEAEAEAEPTVEVAPVAAAAVPTAAAMPALEVQTFLTDLRESLVELARQPAPPAPPATDLAPLVTAVREGFERSSQELSQTNVAIGSLVSCVGDLGKRLNHRIAAAPGGSAPAALALPANAAIEGNRSTWVLLSVTLLIMCWSAVLWWKTGDVRLSVGTLLGANAVACCLLVGRGNR